MFSAFSAFSAVKTQIVSPYLVPRATGFTAIKSGDGHFASPFRKGGILSTVINCASHSLRLRVSARDRHRGGPDLSQRRRDAEDAAEKLGLL
ncbi:MAG: hypothetical protein B6245_07950 [Desulfobacteraceae bacterium 4572_88]|nr:MAG: hypothetical protein B6245_07950 [Desulfobacteraceae bacterium 4572_88]RLC18373.1 MAG: hypothetical protein DRI57_08505 [Deltaproteobacteria bacterium]